jgi:hypothetical protein
LTETTHFRQPLPHFASNSWHRLRLRFSAGGTRVGLDDQVVEVAAAKLPYPRYQITLRGWQPQHHWHIRNLSVH